MFMTRYVVASFSTLLAIVTLASCSNEVAPEPGLPGPGLANVATENTTAKSVGIDAAGGTITTTASNGAVYTLTIPPDAVDSSVQIRMYPVTSMVGYPLASVKAGVHLEPEGMVPAVPLKLTIDLPSGVDMSTIASLASSGNAEDFHLHPAIISGRRVTFTISHFSQYTTGDATLDALLAVRPGQSISSKDFQDALALKYIEATRRGEQPTSAEYVSLLSSWYTTVTAPALDKYKAESNWSTLATDVGDIVSEYNAWLSAIDFCVATTSGTVDVAANVGDSRVKMFECLLHAVETFNAESRTLAGTDPNGPSLTAVNDMAFFAELSLEMNRYARAWDLDVFGLDLEVVLNSLPIKVVIVSRSVPPAFQPSEIGILDIRA